MEASPVLFHACLADIAYQDDLREGEARAARMLPGDDGMRLLHLHRGRLHAWLLVSALHNSVHVGFRGTDSWAQAANNLLLLPQPLEAVVPAAPGGPRGGRVHGGYLQYWAALRTEVLGVVQELVARGDPDMITTAGHSAGGCIAELVALDCAERFARPVRAYTYGAPPFGDRAFGERARRLGNLRTTRVLHEHDAIQRLPRLGYEHVQPRPLVLRARTRPRTAIDHHGLQHYIESLRDGLPRVRIV